MHILRILKSFAPDTRGISALEFALGAPIMILVMLLGIDTTRYVIATRRIDTVASTIGQMLSVNTSGTVSTDDLQFYNDSVMVIYPQVLADAKRQNITWGSDISVTMSSVLFTKVASLYVPKVVWTGGSVQRPCLVPLQSAPDTAASSPTTLPQGTFGPGSLLVVDVSFSFRPTIAPSFMSTIPIKRSYYIAPRYVPAVNYSASSGSNYARVC